MDKINLLCNLQKNQWLDTSFSLMACSYACRKTSAIEKCINIPIIWSFIIKYSLEKSKCISSKMLKPAEFLDFLLLFLLCISAVIYSLFKHNFKLNCTSLIYSVKNHHSSCPLEFVLKSIFKRIVIFNCTCVLTQKNISIILTFLFLSILNNENQYDDMMMNWIKASVFLMYFAHFEPLFPVHWSMPNVCKQ